MSVVAMSDSDGSVWGKVQLGVQPLDLPMVVGEEYILTESTVYKLYCHNSNTLSRQCIKRIISRDSTVMKLQRLSTEMITQLRELLTSVSTTLFTHN